MKGKLSWTVLFNAPVVMAALGYFVDIYDLLLFGIVRVPSLRSLGVGDDQLSSVGASILNWQMTGLLLGGILWGILGDKRGRLSVLMGSILTYSLANIACGFVEDVGVYKLLRLVAGIGLAGELGAGITLVSESLPARYRALGSSLVAGIGLLGAVAAYFSAQLFEWRIAYFVGGGLGLLLLFLRIGVVESSIFRVVQNDASVERGNFLSLFSSRNKFLRYIRCIGIGIPTWFVIGILTTFSDEFGKAKHLAVAIDPGLAIMWCYVGLSAGDLLSGVFSQLLRSRRAAISYMLSFAAAVALLYLFLPFQSTTVFYLLITCMGLGIGYWAMFVTVSAEQFGANLRATVTTTVPNMVRGTVVILTTAYGFLKGEMSVPIAAFLIGLGCFLLAYVSVYYSEETHDKNLDYVE
jgi:predicted MFS family arabinose efflux permease